MDPSDLEKLAWADSIGRIKRDARLAQIPPGPQTPKWDVPFAPGRVSPELGLTASVSIGAFHQSPPGRSFRGCRSFRGSPNSGKTDTMHPHWRPPYAIRRSREASGRRRVCSSNLAQTALPKYDLSGQARAAPIKSVTSCRLKMSAPAHTLCKEV